MAEVCEVVRYVFYDEFYDFLFVFSLNSNEFVQKVDNVHEKLIFLADVLYLVVFDFNQFHLFFWLLRGIVLFRLLHIYLWNYVSNGILESNFVSKLVVSDLLVDVFKVCLQVNNTLLLLL